MHIIMITITTTIEQKIPTSLDHTTHHLYKDTSTKSTETTICKDKLPRGNSRAFCFNRLNDCIMLSRKKLGLWLFYY